jgi:hypothetical protein
LREKEQDLARVRREIQAVLTVIPLLVDDPPTSEVVHEVLLASSRARLNLPDNDMAQLEIYYPATRPGRAPRRSRGCGPTSGRKRGLYLADQSFHRRLLLDYTRETCTRSELRLKNSASLRAFVGPFLVMVR